MKEQKSGRYKWKHRGLDAKGRMVVYTSFIFVSILALGCSYLHGYDEGESSVVDSLYY